MSQQELLRRVVEALDRFGIDYLLTGSFVSSLHGEPRATHDIDIVVLLKESSVESLASFFPPPGFYLDRDSVLTAIREKGMFNLIETREGGKVDFWILPDEPFEASRFSRRQRQGVLGLEVFVSTPEDLILAKLRWSEMSGGSEKHFRDALRVFEVQHGSLDMDYLRRWMRLLGLDSVWSQLLSKAKPIR